MIERISVDPTIHFGKPCVKGTRIKVQDVLELVNAGVSFDELDAHISSCRHLCVEDLEMASATRDAAEATKRDRR